MSDPENILNIIEQALSQIKGTLQELERALSGVDKSLNTNLNGADTTLRTPPHTFMSPRYDEIEITDDDFLGEIFENDGETTKEEFVKALKKVKYDSDISMPDSLFEEELDLSGEDNEILSLLGYPGNEEERVTETARGGEENAKDGWVETVETNREIWGSPENGGETMEISEKWVQGQFYD
jgi:hypothetical protein